MLLVTALLLSLAGNFQICVDHEAKFGEKQILQVEGLSYSE